MLNSTTIMHVFTSCVGVFVFSMNCVCVFESNVALWQPQDSQHNQSHDGEFWLILRGSESGSGLTQQLHCTNNTNNTKAKTMPLCVVQSSLSFLPPSYKLFFRLNKVMVHPGFLHHPCSSSDSNENNDL